MAEAQAAPIPFALPDVGEHEAEAAAQAILSGWVTSGPVMRDFERDFAAFVGGGVQTIAVNSATSGLHLALEAMGVGTGDEVIVPTWTFTATAEVVRHLGATPVIVDVERDTLNINLAAVAEAVTDRTKAVIPVHFAGLPVDVAGLRRLLGDGEIKIVEDAAHALPAVGTAGMIGNAAASDATVFSFYATKTITTGEGGMITSRSAAVADRCRVMRLHGIDRDSYNRHTSSQPTWSYDVIAPGFKYNMPDVAAAMGRVQLARAMQMHTRRQQIADYYFQELADLPLVLPARAPDGQLHSWHLFVVRLDGGAPVDRDDFIQRMASAGVGTGVHFIPLHAHSLWRRLVPRPEVSVPVAGAEARRAVSLPIYSKMSDEQVERVVAAARLTLS